MTEETTLVLGHNFDLAHVRGFSWTNIPDDLNVADYHNVIMDLGLGYNVRELRRSIDLTVLPPATDFANLMFGGGEVICIGVLGQKLGSNPYKDIHWWMPARPRFEKRTGTQIVDVREEWSFYFASVGEWYFHAFLQDIRPNFRDRASYIRRVIPGASSFEGSARPLAETIYDAAIAFQMSYRIENSRGDRRSTDSVYWLPPVTDGRHRRAVEKILQHRYSIELRVTPPDWVEGFSLPNEEVVAGNLSELQDEISRLEEKEFDLKQRLEDERRFKQLLYERGEVGLEEIVRDALEILGAKVQEPDVPGREDGRLIDPSGRPAILEIKGRTGTLKLSDVRQLEQWRTDAELEDQYSAKPILIGNLNSDSPLSDRGKVFPSNCVRTATRYGHCLVRTEQLFQAVVAHQRGNFQSEEFWDALFQSEGVCGYAATDE